MTGLVAKYIDITYAYNTMALMTVSNPVVCFVNRSPEAAGQHSTAHHNVWCCTRALRHERGYGQNDTSARVWTSAYMPLCRTLPGPCPGQLLS